MHRELVDKLVNGGILKASEIGQILVEREADEKAPALPVKAEEGEKRAARKLGE